MDNINFLDKEQLLALVRSVVEGGRLKGYGEQEYNNVLGPHSDNFKIINITHQKNNIEIEIICRHKIS